jgi:hypothetical protein
MFDGGHMKATQTDVYGWQGVTLQNRWVTLRAVPDIGGRIVSLQLGSYEYMWMDKNLLGKLYSPEEHVGDGSMSAWKNYGGDKTWPAPQGWDNHQQWHGPPDPVLDGGRYRLDLAEADATSASVRMTSPPDPVTGVQITRQATLHTGGSRVTLDLTFTNTAEHTTRWSIWDVLQHRAERVLPDGTITHEDACVVTAPINPKSRHDQGYVVLFADPDNPQWEVEDDLFVGRYLYRIGKVGLDSMAGWIAFNDASRGHTFVAQFDPEPGAEYPDNGSTVECWTVGEGEVPGVELHYEGSGVYLLETEVLSPLYDFAPGESHTFTIEWAVCRCPGKVVDVSEAGCASQMLRAVRNGEYIHTTGVFGAFDSGQLRLQILDAEGKVIGEQGLGPANPLTVSAVDTVIRAADATATQLQVRSDTDGTVRTLGEATIFE